MPFGDRYRPKSGIQPDSKTKHPDSITQRSMAESASAAAMAPTGCLHRRHSVNGRVFPDTTEVRSRFTRSRSRHSPCRHTQRTDYSWPTDNPCWLNWTIERAIDNLCLHISRNLFSFLCRLEPFWGIGRLLVVLVAVRTAGSQWRFEIRRSETAAETRLNNKHTIWQPNFMSEIFLSTPQKTTFRTSSRKQVPSAKPSLSKTR